MQVQSSNTGTEASLAQERTQNQNALDVVSFAPFDEIAARVQTFAKKNFSRSQLAKILSVDPCLYQVKAIAVHKLELVYNDGDWFDFIQFYTRSCMLSVPRPFGQTNRQV